MRKQKLIASILIIFGSCLEVFYYVARFTGDGTNAWIALVQGIALTALLMGLFLLRATGWAWIFIIMVGAFSVFNTAAGQRQSLTVKAEEQAQDINSRVILDLELKLERKRKAYDEAVNMKSSSFDTVQDQYRWRTAVSSLGIDDIESEIDQIEDQIIKLKTIDVDDSEIGRLYSFYADLIGADPEWLQFWLQVALSLYIAMMAPVGILIFPKPEAEDMTEYIEHWVHASWVGVRQGRDDKALLSKDKYIKFASDRGHKVSSDLYDRIKKAAVRAKVVDNNTVTVNNEGEAIKAIIRRFK